MATKQSIKSLALAKAKSISSKGKAKSTKKKLAVPEGQNPPQSKSYTIKKDESFSAKPVGMRWTKEGARKLGKKETSRPSAADIKMYSGKTFKIPRKSNSNSEDGSYRYMYSEKRIDKSDFNRKEKFAKGGTVRMPEKDSPEWHQIQIAKKTVKMSPAMASMMGGMSMEEAEGCLTKYGIKFEHGGEVKELDLLVSDSQGIYIPATFVHDYDLADFGFTEEEVKGYNETLSNPDNEEYWDAWDEVLDRAVTKDGATLMQNGDLWLVPEGYEFDDEGFARGGKLKANYLPKRDIKSLTTKSGKTISVKDLLDGAYVKKGIKFGEGGSTSDTLELLGRSVAFRANYKKDGEEKRMVYIIKKGSGWGIVEMGIGVDDDNRDEGFATRTPKVIETISDKDFNAKTKSGELELTKAYTIKDSEVFKMDKKEAANYFGDLVKSSSVHIQMYEGGSHDVNADGARAAFVEDVTSDFMSEDEFKKETGYSITNFDQIVDKSGDDLEELSADNTYNWGYLGLADFNIRTYKDNIEDRVFLVLTPHISGDIRSNYGDCFIKEFEDNDEAMMYLHEALGFTKTILITFEDDSEIIFYSEQNSDVHYFKVSENEELDGTAALMSDYIDEKFTNWEADDFIDSVLSSNGTRLYARGGKLKANYLPKRDIESITTTEGKVIMGNNIFDGAYVSKRVKLENGGDIDVEGAGMFKSGGKIKQRPPQSGSYKAARDKEERAKPVGHRFTDKLAAKLGFKPFKKPTAEQVEKYNGKGIYSENRKDKSDLNPMQRFEKGGESDKMYETLWYAVSEGGMGAWDSLPQKTLTGLTWGEAVLVCKGIAKDRGSQVRLSTSAGYNNQGYYFHHQQVSFENGGENAPMADNIGDSMVQYEEGGIVYPSERLDVVEQSIEERELELFIENDSDLYRQRIEPIHKNLMTKIAQQKFDINLAPKIYMYLIDAGIKKYNADYGGMSLTRRKKENLAKEFVNNFLDEASYGNYEDYLPKKYQPKPKEDKKEMGGDIVAETPTDGAGEFAYGGAVVPKISNQEAREYTENLLPFRGNNLDGRVSDNGDYTVFSYGYYPLWFYSKAEQKWYGNKDKVSSSTSKQMSQSRPAYDAQMLSKEELDIKMGQSAMAQIKEAGGNLDSLIIGSATDNPQFDITAPEFQGSV